VEILSERACRECGQPIQAMCSKDEDKTKRKDWILANGAVTFVEGTIRAKDNAHVAVIGETVLGSAPAASIAAPTRDSVEVTAQDISEAAAVVSKAGEADRVREMVREHSIRQEEMSEAGELGDIDEAIGSVASGGVFPDASTSDAEDSGGNEQAEAIKQLDVVDSGGQAATTPAANTADDEQAAANKTRRGEHDKVQASTSASDQIIDPASLPPPTGAVRPALLLASPQGQSTASAASASASAAQALPVSRAGTVDVSVDDDVVLQWSDVAWHDDEDPAAAEADAKLRAELQEEAVAAAAERADGMPAVGSVREEGGGFVRIVTSEQGHLAAVALVIAIRRIEMAKCGEDVKGVARWPTQKKITRLVKEQWWKGMPTEERQEVWNRVGCDRQDMKRTKESYFRAAVKAHFGDVQWFYFIVAIGDAPGPDFVTRQIPRASSRDTAEQSGGGSGSQARGSKTGIRHKLSEAKVARDRAKLASKRLEKEMKQAGYTKRDRRWPRWLYDMNNEVEDRSWHSTWGPRCRGADVNPCPPAVRAALARMPPHCHARPHPRAIAAQQVFDSPRRGGPHELRLLS